MCQVHTGAHVSLLAPGKYDYTACNPGKTTAVQVEPQANTPVRCEHTELREFPYAINCVPYNT